MTHVWIVVYDGIDGGQVVAVFSAEHLAKTYAHQENKKKEDRRKADAKKHRYKYNPSPTKLVVEAWDVDSKKCLIE